MPILYAELQLAGRQVACDVASFSFSQATDEKGRPSSVVRVGLLKVIISGEAAGWHLWEEIKFNPYRRESGHLVFFQNEGITARRYTFYDAALVALAFRHDGKGASRQAATQVELHFSAATIELDGIRLEAHSLIPWKTDAQTSARALTRPADPQPAAHLTAGLGLLAIRKAVEAAPKFLDKTKAIPFEGAARTVTLLPGLLLAPVNGSADPAKDYDWQLYHRNHAQPTIPPPPKPDAVRLAELERTLAAQTLTAQEEEELIILLAKVKGIYVQRAAEFDPKTGVLSIQNAKYFKRKAPQVRDATDAEAAEIALIRDKHNISKKKNVAYAEGELAGKSYRNEAHSGTNSKPGTAKTKSFESQLIKTHPTAADIERGVDNSDVRAYDSEVKILEELLEETAGNPSVSGNIKVVSERPICESCWDGISQTEKARPNLKIERVQLPKKLNP